MSIAKTARLGVTYYDPLKADDGYTFFAPQGGKNTWLIDMKGNIVNRWVMPYGPGAHGVLLPNGNLFTALRVKSHEELGLPMEFAGVGGMFMEMDWDGNIVWQIEAPNQFHTFYVKDNGNILYHAWAPECILPDEIAARVKGGRPGTELNGQIYGDAVYEIDRNGNRVWEWRAYEHLDPEVDELGYPLETRRIWPYINSIWVCRDGNVLLGTRYLNQATKVEYPSGKVIGRYGRGRLSHQHDCRELDNGNFLIFDNGNDRRGYEPNYSRIVEIEPVTDQIVWEYKEDPPYIFYTCICGANQRLANGNTVMCDSWSGRIFEVTAAGELVWEYLSPFVGPSQGTNTNRMWRAYRYARDYPGLQGKDLDPGRFLWENRLFGSKAFQEEFRPIIF